ncbi:MAG TPA: family 10 glycosylhydrolase [Chthoniobacterales bacterium]
MKHYFSLGCFLCSLGLLLSPFRARGAEREFRGAWVATVYNLDWPSRPGLPTETQEAQLRAILDRAAALHLNAILLQVRPASDALYASDKEPWSEFLTGHAGVPPGYDPLAFAIREAHARGIELHAWVNPFRAAISVNEKLPPNHIAKKHPEWVRRFSRQLWVDPGDPAARAYVIGVICDIVRRYDVDGVHLDDYFYPYPLKPGEATFPDAQTWARFGIHSGLSRADWRRENINDFVRTLYRAVKAIKPDVRVGISPFGIWRPHVPPTIKAGIDAYAQLFADSRKWLANGWVDYLAPQLYWGIQPADQSFPVLLDWWRAQSHGRPVWPGIATERIGTQRPAREIIEQIEMSRRGTSSPGAIQWSMKALMRDQGGIDRLLKSGPYAEPAAPPGR